MKTGVLLINLGTPESPTTNGLRKYHHTFFSDKFVIDNSAFLRFFLKYFIILPFRSPKMAKLYEEIWTEDGPPLLLHGLEVQKQLQISLGDDYVVELGMNYSKPSVPEALQNLKEQEIQSIVAIPLFPQHASSTTASSRYNLQKSLKAVDYSPTISFVENFYDNEKFVHAWKKRGEAYNLTEYDHIVFSYHGVPESHIIKDNPEGFCLSQGCCDSISKSNRLCYKAQCYELSRLISKQLDIEYTNYSVAFQSRFGKTPWTQPYLDDTLAQMVDSGNKKLLVFSPSFIADCLETTHEIGVEYTEAFLEIGGESITLVESLNSSQHWIEALKDIVLRAKNTVPRSFSVS